MIKFLKMMKYIMLTFSIFIAPILGAQVLIGKQTITGNSTILEFNNITGNNKGIILPALEIEPNFITVSGVPSPNNGTFIFDRSDKKVKMFQNNIWVDLTTEGDNNKINVNNSNENTSEQGVIIGNSTSNAEGVLVLESTNRAIILPFIENPHTTVKTPYPGMMCYDAVSKSIAVFDGKLWHYWN